MDKEIEQLADRVYCLMSGAVKNLWKKEDAQFLEKLALDVAREKFLYETATNKDEHRRNLEHLAATLQGEIARKGLKLKVFAKDHFSDILRVIIEAVALPMLKIAINSKINPVS